MWPSAIEVKDYIEEIQKIYQGAIPKVLEDVYLGQMVDGYEYLDYLFGHYMGDNQADDSTLETLQYFRHRREGASDEEMIINYLGDCNTGPVLHRIEWLNPEIRKQISIRARGEESPISWEILLPTLDSDAIERLADWWNAFCGEFYRMAAYGASAAKHAERVKVEKSVAATKGEEYLESDGKPMLNPKLVPASFDRDYITRVNAYNYEMAAIKVAHELLVSDDLVMLSPASSFAGGYWNAVKQHGGRTAHWTVKRSGRSGEIEISGLTSQANFESIKTEFEKFSRKKITMSRG
ncbi:hypothetical protein [Lentzea sp. NEAU-D7]|uniref:hypothetical protein n=1 Tax=Lentzea sp. NEAU-D7 TaxID=2994667 RepID=UPI00224B7D73|nr:hypothetical protein [Lentzea sp. NEAU-D7]MCX2954501.1 hypothetical protein [Lentzea sp. NEAU-D7]